MSRYVFILGAGASKHAGAPLMAEFIDTARVLAAQNPTDEHSPSLEQVFQAISKLQSVHSKSGLDIVNLETVFSAFEMAELLRIPPWEPDLVRSMKRLISWTLDQKVCFEVSKGKVVSSAGCEALAILISKLASPRDSAPNCTVITFNYDLAVDMALHSQGLNPVYGFAAASGGVKLLKLHGSVGWHRCSNESCKEIVLDTLPMADPYGPGTVPMKWSKLKKRFRGQTTHCGKEVGEDCVIVPPSWDKADYRTELVKVWRSAASELRSATNIFVCGYSLPETDSFFPYLYGLGTVRGEPLERFWVFDPSEETHRRFRDLLGPAALARFGAYPLTFEKAVQHMSSVLTKY